MSETTVQLLSTFDLAVSRLLAPMFLRLGAFHESGQSNYDGYLGPSTLSRKNFSQLEGSFFWWIHRFTYPKTIFEICYGDREFIIETTIYYPDINARFGAWELLLATTIPDSQAMTGNAWVMSSDFIEKTVSSISDGSLKYWHLLSEPDPAIVDRAQELRGRRLIYAQEEQRKRDLQRASIRASRAFHENRMDEAIALLSPFKDDGDLPESSRMLLQLARKQKS